MGSEGEPSELSDETEPERYLWWRPAAVLIEMGLECWILSVLLLSMAVSTVSAVRDQRGGCRGRREIATGDSI